MPLNYSLGLDLGGTHIKGAVVSFEGKVLSEHLAETPPGRKVEEVVQALIEAGRKLLANYPDVQGIGLGAPGLVDLARRTVRVAPNFPTWRDVPLAEMIGRQFLLPMTLDNDVNCFGLAEHRWGAGRGFRHLLALAIGTGIGGAIILDGKLFRGSSGAAAELGHISVDLWGPKCACGNLGCVERYLGERWLTLAAREELGDDSITSPEQVSVRAAAGDETARRFIESRGEILGAACVTLIHIFDPEAIVIGGGIAQAGEPLFQGIRRAIQQRAYSILAAKVQILPAQLGPTAGALGAAALVFDQNTKIS